MQIDKKTKRRVALLSVLIALTLAFIYGNSMQSGAASGNLSGGIRLWLESLLHVPVDEFFLRKAAHFSEYALLGVQGAALLSTLRAVNGARLLLLPAAGFFAAAIDETIQIFSGRGSSLLDVWLDFSGFLTGFFLLLLLLRALSRLPKKRKEVSN